MEIELTKRESEILIDAMQHRLDTDKNLLTDDSLREELEDLLRKIEENEYL